MSCHLLDKTHVDLLVDAFVNGPSDAEEWGGLMISPEKLGFLLANENLMSVAWHDTWGSLANSDDPDVAASADTEAPIRVALGDFRNTRITDEDVTWRNTYQPTKLSYRLSGVETLAAINTWRYHSNECPGWRHSEAKRLTNEIYKLVVEALPGYDEHEGYYEDGEFAASASEEA